MKKIMMLLFLFIIVGCSSASLEQDKQNSQLTIHTSVYPIQYVAEQITGEASFVQSIYPPGVEAHTYEPTSREITAIAEGDAFIYLGGGMEGFTESAAETLSTHEVAFIELGKHKELFLSKEESDHTDHDHSDYDPHIWLDPLRMIRIAERVTEELSALRPANKEQYRKNLEVLTENMIQLDEEFKETLQSKTEKHIIVSHAAYGYWEERYGIKQIAISGKSSGNEASQKELKKIAELAKDKNLQYVIFEQNGSDRVSTIIQEHINADALHIHNLEVLTDRDINNNEDYVTLMRKNLETLDKATN